MILTKRPSITAGVLHELTQIAEKPQGIFRETALNCINEEYEESKSNKKVTKPNFENETNSDFAVKCRNENSDFVREAV